MCLATKLVLGCILELELELSFLGRNLSTNESCLVIVKREFGLTRLDCFVPYLSLSQTKESFTHGFNLSMILIED